jgi:hypothetical protein
MPWSAPGVEMGTHQAELGSTQIHRGRDRHPALQHQGKLESMGLLQRQGRQDRVSPITSCDAVAHGWGIAEAQPEGLSSLHYIFLRAETSDQNPPSLAGRDRWHRAIAAEGFLHQHDQW